MVSSINNSNAIHNTGIQKTLKSPAANTEETGESKMRNPPGQEAKAAIKSSEPADQPANIQGKVASAYARWLDLEGLLTLQEAASADDTAETPADDPVVEDSELVENAASETDVTIAQQDELSAVATVSAENDASIAAALLEDAKLDGDGTTE